MQLRTTPCAAEPCATQTIVRDYTVTLVLETVQQYQSFFQSDTFRNAYKECCKRATEATAVTATVIQHIRKQFPTLSPQESTLIAELTNGMLYAVGKEKYSEGCLYVRHTLEQTTSQSIAQYHASRFVGCNHILELCTGSASDTFALSTTAQHITTIEHNALTCAIAEYNAAQLGITNITFINADAQEFVQNESLQQFDGLWADPARRTTEKRISTDATQYQPPLPWIMSVPINGVCGIKISPAITLPSLPADWKREWIGFRNECREQLLWKNTECSDGAVRIVDADAVWSPQAIAKTVAVYNDILGSPPAYIIEPHAALIRSGHLAEFYETNTIMLLDSTIAYGVSSTKPDSPFTDVFEILHVLPYSQKRLQSVLHELQWNSRTEIKKRGIAQTPDEIRNHLTFPQTTTWGTVILTRVQGKPIMVICKRV